MQDAFTYDVVFYGYVVQCEMIFYFIRFVREFVKQKQYPSIDAAIKVSLWICLLYSTNIFVHLFRIFMTSVKNCVN